MKFAIDSKGMKSIDDYTVEVLKIPAMVLMERAAYEVAAVIRQQVKKTDRILAVCGTGNNGGDGIAAGRILYLQGYHVAILLVGDENKRSEQTKQQLEIARNLNIPIENYNKLHEYNIIIDAIFGVGLSRPVTGEYLSVIDNINLNNNKVFAIDIPSGISADYGMVMNAAVRADETITFGLCKKGLLVYPGADYAGKITIADIGFPELAFRQAEPNTFYYEREDLNRLPVRRNHSHKGTFGKVLVIAGSKGMSGAAYLSAKAAYKTGAGLVKVLTASENRIILQTSLPEALFAAYDEEDAEIAASISWASAIVIGPGLGQSETAERLLDQVLKEAKVPVIIDADGINLLAKRLDRECHDPQSRRNTIMRLLAENTVLTPHLMELSRLIGIPVTKIGDNIIDTALFCSYNKLIYVIKEARTIVSNHNSHYINLSGNNGMATGGSGDVLTGMIAALIAQGMENFDAACLGVYLHGLAGDVAAKEKGKYSLMAGDIVNAIEQVMNQVG
jgi:ADP-dependent NAD(P)H-hydrate dehydratase / NAD(P)H-hydrate epimerase